MPSEVLAWAHGRRFPLRPFEFDTLLSLDREFVMFHAVKNQKTKPRQDAQGLKNLIDAAEPEHAKPKKTKK